MSSLIFKVVQPQENLELECTVIDTATEKKTTEKYSIIKQPAGSTRLVKEQMNEISKNLSLNTVIEQTYLSADLMYLAYCALAGTDIQHKMSGMQKNLLDLCAEAAISAGLFKDESESIIRNVVMSFKLLYKYKEEMSIEVLSRCAENAGRMSAEAKRIAGEFKKLSDKTEGVLEDSQKLENAKEQEIEKIKTSRRELKAIEARQKKATEDLKAAVSQMQKRYQEARDDQRSAETKAMVGMICGAVAQTAAAGLNAYASSMKIGGSSVTVVNTKPAEKEDPKKDEKKQKEEEKIKETVELKKLQETESEKQGEVDVAEADVKVIKGELEDAKKEEDADKVSEKEEALEKKEADLAAKEKVLAEAKEKTEKQQAKLNAIAASLNQLAAQADEVKKFQMQQAGKAASAKSAILEAQFKLEDENRKALAELAEVAVKLSNLNTSENLATTAVQTLHIAVAALKKIVVALSNAAMFWDSLKSYCSNLSKSDLVANIKMINRFKEEERAIWYYENDFMVDCMTYIAKWVALREVCAEYEAASLKARSKVSKNILKSPTADEAKKQARDLGKEFLVSVRKSQKEHADSSRNLKVELAKLKEAEKAIA